MFFFSHESSASAEVPNAFFKPRQMIHSRSVLGCGQRYASFNGSSSSGSKNRPFEAISDPSFLGDTKGTYGLVGRSREVSGQIVPALS